MGESPTPESGRRPDAIAARMRHRVGMRSKSTAPEAPARRRILIVDNHALVRRGLTALIDNEADLTVCAAVATHQAGLEAIATCRPDLVITDLVLDDGEGLDLVRDIRAGHEDLPVLVLSMHDAACLPGRRPRLRQQAGAGRDAAPRHPVRARRGEVREPDAPGRAQL